jgi:hypothetical protein
MHAEIGRAPLVIAHMPRRHARPHLFTPVARGLLAAGVAAGAVLLGLGALTDQAQSGTAPAAAYGWIGR